MFRKIRDFLYAVVHTSGRLFDVVVNLGPFRVSLWVGRENPDAVRFAVEADLYYGPHGSCSLEVEIEVGVITAQLYLTRSYSE